MYSSGEYCKHILFSLCRVLKVSRYDKLLLKSSYTAQEITQIFANSKRNLPASFNTNSKPGHSTDADVSVRRAYRLMNGLPVEEDEEGSENKKEEDESKRKAMDEEVYIYI